MPDRLLAMDGTDDDDDDDDDDDAPRTPAARSNPPITQQ